MTDPESDGHDPRPAKNRWTRAIDRSPTVGTALAGFGAYMVGAVLLIVAVFLILPGVLFVVATLGTGSWQNRTLGVVLIIVGSALFAIGRWVTAQYAVQRRS